MVRDILHLGLYQIYELDKVPESAAVNESVTLAKKYSKNPKAGALVNAVLRKAATKGTLQEPVSYADRYSHPDELISLLKANLPKGKLEPMLIADNAAPQTVVQVNTLRISAEELAERLNREHVSAKPHEWMPDCLVLSGTGSLEQLPAFREGLFYVQDPASRLAALHTPYEIHIFSYGDHGASLGTLNVTAPRSYENPDLAHWFPMALRFLEHIFRHDELVPQPVEATEYGPDMRIGKLLDDPASAPLLAEHLPELVELVQTYPDCRALTLKKFQLFTQTLPQERFDACVKALTALN